MMRELAKGGFGERLTADECMEVVEYVSEFGKSRELSLRLLEPSYRKVIYAKDAGVDWRQLVATQLHEIGRNHVPKVPAARTFDLDCLRQVVQDYPNDVGAQETAWRALTKRSRATFFRLKKTLMDETADGEAVVAATG